MSCHIRRYSFLQNELYDSRFPSIYESRYRGRKIVRIGIRVAGKMFKDVWVIVFTVYTSSAILSELFIIGEKFSNILSIIFVSCYLFIFIVWFVIFAVFVYTRTRVLRNVRKTLTYGFHEITASSRRENIVELIFVFRIYLADINRETYVGIGTTLEKNS